MKAVFHRAALTAILLTAPVFMTSPSQAASQPLITGTYHTSSIQTYGSDGNALSQIDAKALIGHPVISKNPDTDMLEVKTDRGSVFVTEDSVEADMKAAPPTPTHCVRIGAASQDEVGGATNNLGRNCHGS